MNPRELIILLLGLAIVAVVLRGLYVAIQARRGQIRLAIDKSIPKDVDLESLEMAELPSGGARVIRRDQPGKERLERATERARAMDLEDDEDVPVLMDAVQIRAANVEPEADPQPEEDAQEPELPDSDYDDTEQFDDGPFDADQFDDQEEAEDPDAVLMDYGEADDLASVAPDYEPEPEQDEDYADDDGVEEGDEGDEEGAADDDYPDEKYDADYYDDDYAEDEDDVEESDDPRPEPEVGSGALDDDFDEFSMTAGERIGFEGRERVQPAQQTSLFDDEGSAAPAAAKPPGKRKSLFAAFTRKKQVPQPEPAPEPEPEPVAELPEEPVYEPPEPEEEWIDEEAAEFAAAPEPVQERAPQPEPVAPVSNSPAGEPSEVLVINIMAREGRQFYGDDILHALITAGLKFGDMNIFHLRLSKDPNSPVIFSVANILNPGVFDLNTMDSFTTVGISFFLALPSPINNLDALDKMLATADQIRTALDGELKDDNRNGMTAQTIEHYRQRVRDFELRKLKAAGGRG